MQTTEDSATAYDKLSAISAQADRAAQLAFEWTKVRRALGVLALDLSITEPINQDTIVKIADFMSFVDMEWHAMREYAAKKQTQANELNERIQNGVYNG